MRRGGFLFLAVLLASTLAIAQGTTANQSQYGQNPATPPVTSQDSSQTGQTATVQGCLSSSSLGDNTFTLTQDQTATAYPLTGGATELRSHVGHEVAIRGRLISNASNASSSNLPASSDPSRALPNLTGTSAPNHTTENTLQVSGVQMVSDHCAGTGTTHPSGAATSQDDFRSATSENSPQPTTVLPLLGLVGLGSLIAGLIVRR
jgi:hypothetical protein